MKNIWHHKSIFFESDSGQKIRTKQIYMIFFELVGMEVIYVEKEQNTFENNQNTQFDHIYPFLEIVLQKRILLNKD